MDKQTDSPKPRSGTEIGAENFTKLQSYFTQLEREGGQVPLTKAGRPNLSAIALNCGFDRQVLYTNSRCKELVQGKVRSIGGTTQTSEPISKAAFDPKDKRIRELEKRVADLTERLNQAEKLLAEAQPYQRLYHHACATGRSLVP
jgi:hypothetical protein